MSMGSMTRRGVLAGMAGAALPLGGHTNAAPSPARARPSGQSIDVLVIGAGVFGSWTAWQLLQSGKRVLLVDAWGPGHSRSSSGGESRMTRTGYGRDLVYTRLALESMEGWRWLSAQAETPLFLPHGVLFMSARMEPYMEQTLRVHRELGIAIEELDRTALQRRFPLLNANGLEAAIFEPMGGPLMARRAVQTLVRQFVAAGGEYRQAAIAALEEDAAAVTVRTLAGETLHAEQIVFACGAWLPKLFPQLLGQRIFPTRQEAFFLSAPAGDPRYDAAHFPGWADFNDGDVYYGFPDLEGRGMKVARDEHGPPIDPDTSDRVASANGLQDIREFLQRRFPQLAERPLSETRVCQYENSSNGDFLIDRHPQWRNVCLVGAGSGHGFKHGPAVGRYAARLVTGQLPTSELEPRFSLATKMKDQHRSVL